MNWPASASRLASVSLFAVSLLTLVTGCEKANDLGLELPGTSPITSQFLDLPVAAYTVRRQPVETVKANHVLVGQLRDNFVGATTAKAYLNMQVQPYLVLSAPDSLPAKFTNTKLDSVVFSLAFDQVYGTAAQPFRFDLFTLQQRLDDRMVYNSTSSVATGNALLTNFAAPLNRNKVQKQRTPAASATDTATTLVTTMVPDRVIRVRMLKQPGTAALANAVFAAMQDASFNQEKLNSVWPGIALAPAAGFAGAIVGFNRTAESRVTFYYTGTSTTGKTRKRNYSLFFANIPTQAGVTDSKFFTQLSTDFSGSALATLSNPGQQVAASATNGNTYLQEGIGLGTRIELQGLDNIRNNPDLVINRAELRIPIKQFSNGLLPYPSSVYLYEVNSLNQVLTRTSGPTTYERLVQQDGSNPIGTGSPATAAFPSNQDPTQYYTVSVTEYLQAYLQNRLNGELPTGLLLSPTLSSNLALTLNRAQLAGSDIKLRVYYSKLR